jgi:adenine-specific DNA-methyltransferase
MALHPGFQSSPYVTLLPAHRWFPADEAMRAMAYEKLLPPHWKDRVDYWAVDFDYESRPEIIHGPRSIKTGEPLPGWQPGDELVEFAPIQQGSFIFENEWQSFRACKDRNLERTSAPHTYSQPGRYIVAFKVIDIFGNDTMTLIPVNMR